MNEEPIATKSSICKKLLILPEEEYSVGSWGHITTSSHHFRNFTVKTKTSTKVTLVTFLFFFFFLCMDTGTHISKKLHLM